MSDIPYDQQPTRSLRVGRILPPLPIEPGATVLAHAIAPPPFLAPPKYRGLSPGPPVYRAPLAAPGPVLPPFRAHPPPIPLELARRIGYPAPAFRTGAVPEPARVPEPVRAPEPSGATEHEPNLAPNSNDTDAEHDSEAKTYTVMVTLEWSELIQPHSGTRSRPSKEVKRADSKPIELELVNATWAVLIRAMLGAHKLEHKYRTSNLHGPPIKIHWRGSPGGAKLPCSIDDKEGWERVQALILKKDPNLTPVFVSFCMDDLQRFRVRTRGEPEDGFDEDGDGFGRKLPRTGDVIENSDIHVLHGRAIKDLESRWLCPLPGHHGEHGGYGHCYQPTPDGPHVPLNMRRKKMWAAAIHAKTATLEVPPELPEFIPADRITGSAASRSRRSAAAAAPSTADVGNLISSILAPITASMVGAMSAMAGVPNVAAPPALLAPTSRIAAPPSTVSYLIRTPSPVPNPTPEALISACLDSFFRHTNIDLSSRKEYLVHNLLTPNLIKDVPFDHLLFKLRAPEGHVIEYCNFCAEWSRKYGNVSR
ncbi:hypothetical protein FRC07_009077 [Ceratobasidium sp. 392]|nr:hypothetical protein FRC07_009077 [Ceratobasidium sp. 392]